MLLLVIFAGVLFLTPSQGQQDICNYDPDLIFFDNAQLEKLRKSILKGDCSQPSVVWKVELNNALQTYFRNGKEMDDLSDRDRERLNELASYQKDSEEQRGSRVRFPDETKQSPDIFFESESRRSPYQQIQTESNDFYPFSKRNHRNRFFPRRFYPGGRLKRQTQLSDQFGSKILSERQPKFFMPNNQNLNNNFFTPSSPNQDNKNVNYFKDQRRPQIGPSNFSPSNFPVSSDDKLTDQNRIQNLFVPNPQNVPAEGLFKPIEKTNPQLQQINDIRPLGDLFRLNEQNPSQRQRRPNKERKPANQRRPVLQRPQTTTPSTSAGTTLPGPPTWPTAPSLCVRRCPNTPEYNPVCGTDRVTYVNPGRLRCEQQCGKANVIMNHYGTCVTTTTTQPSSTATPTTTPRAARRTASRSRNSRINPRTIQ